MKTLVDKIEWPEEENYSRISRGDFEAYAYAHGLNDDIKECKKALTKSNIVELPSEKELSKVVQEAGQEWESYEDPITPLYVYIAKSILKMLKGEL